jgi:hypothetical protein
MLAGQHFKFLWRGIGRPRERRDAGRKRTPYERGSDRQTAEMLTG